jgi:hypothetical protein
MVALLLAPLTLGEEIAVLVMQLLMEARGISGGGGIVKAVLWMDCWMVKSRVSGARRVFC